MIFLSNYKYTLLHCQCYHTYQNMITWSPTCFRHCNLNSKRWFLIGTMRTLKIRYKMMQQKGIRIFHISLAKEAFVAQWDVDSMLCQGTLSMSIEQPQVARFRLFQDHTLSEVHVCHAWWEFFKTTTPK